MNIRIVSVIAALLGTQPWLTAYAAQPEFSGHATVGYEHDSNVSIDAIDSNTGESDSALVIDLGIDGSVAVGDRSKLHFGYAYNDTSYSSFSEFDLAIHHLYGSFSRDVYGLDGELGLNRFAARLDGDGFVDVTYVPISLAKLLGTSWYLRGSIAHTRKDYADLDERDADSNALRADVYYLIDGMQHYFSMSMQHEREDADTQRYDYDGNRVRLLYAHPLSAGTRPLRLKAHAQYEIRDYSPDESLLAVAPRQDKRAGLGVEAVVTLNEYLELSGVMDYADNRSTLATADYSETRYSINVGVRF